jgi:phosphoribosylformylglycinamidine synthase subunit PurQ / glutaminase
MRIGIIQFPGSNCERETILAVKRAGMEPVEYLWNEPLAILREMAGYIIVGGFSYEDRSRAGIIAALDPIMQELKQQSERGKPILGICNGAQILVETGLVPGLEQHKVGMVLAENKRILNDQLLGVGFYNAWVHIRLSDEYQRNAFTRHLTPKRVLPMPIAHREGRFMMPSTLLQEVQYQGLNVFQYCDEAGQVEACFPINPNGSMDNIAAVSNKAGNVLAMMPHPERTPHGEAIFQSMRDYIREGHCQKTSPLSYYPRRVVPCVYQKPARAQEYIIEQIITDHQALTVQQALQRLGFLVQVKRLVHWEIEGDSRVLWDEAMKQTGILFNARKEVERHTATWQNPMAKTYLVRAKEEVVGMQKLQLLTKHFAICSIQSIRYGVLWQFSSEQTDVAVLMDDILQTNIIANPYAHDCYHYPID